MPHPSTPRGLTPAQRDTMTALLNLGIEDAPVTIGVNTLAARAQLTGRQTEQALIQLVNAATLTKSWDPDKYVWTYRLTAGK